MRQAERQRKAVEAIRKEGQVYYDYEIGESTWPVKGKPPVPSWLRKLVGDDFFSDVVAVGPAFPINADDVLSEHVSGLTALVRLNLAHAQVTDAGLEHLNGLTRLEHLVLSGTQITDAGLQYLKGLTSLECLCLDRTQIGDIRLEHLEGMTNLVLLDLRDTQVRDERVKKLQRALPNCRIYHWPLPPADSSPIPARISPTAR